MYFICRFHIKGKPNTRQDRVVEAVKQGIVLYNQQISQNVPESLAVSLAVQWLIEQKIVSINWANAVKDRQKFLQSLINLSASLDIGLTIQPQIFSLTLLAKQATIAARTMYDPDEFYRKVKPELLERFPEIHCDGDEYCRMHLRQFCASYEPPRFKTKIVMEWKKLLETLPHNLPEALLAVVDKYKDKISPTEHAKLAEPVRNLVEELQGDQDSKILFVQACRLHIHLYKERCGTPDIAVLEKLSKIAGQSTKPLKELRGFLAEEKENMTRLYILTLLKPLMKIEMDVEKFNQDLSVQMTRKATSLI